MRGREGIYILIADIEKEQYSWVPNRMGAETNGEGWKNSKNLIDWGLE